MTAALDAALSLAALARERHGMRTEAERWQAARRAAPAPAPAPAPTLPPCVGGRPLRPVQILALARAAALRPPYGALVLAGVGHGKTRVSLLLPAVWQCRSPVLLVPAALRAAAHRAVDEWSLAGDVFPIPKIVSYEALSGETGEAVLPALAPDSVICDEAQFLRRPEAGRTRRVLRFVAENPLLRVAFLSGSLTKASLHDWAHLAETALRDLSPLPLSTALLDRWASVMDARGMPDGDARVTVAQCLGTGERAGARVAFADALSTWPGVTCAPASSCGSDLVLVPLHAPMPPGIVGALDGLVARWVLPDGTDLVDAMTHAAHARTLSLGWWYRVAWPGGVPDAAWLTARREWGACVRWSLGRWGDTPGAVERAVRAGRGGTRAARFLIAWDAARLREPPMSEVVWVDDGAPAWRVTGWYVEAAHAAAPCLGWYRHRAIGELLEKMGESVVWAGEDPPEAPDSREVIWLSVEAHRRGHNLQGAGIGTPGWSRNLVLEPPTGGEAWEQLLGRTHRAGQAADTVVAGWAAHAWPLRAAVERARVEAAYAEETTGQPQKLLYAREVLGDWKEALQSFDISERADITELH